MATNDPRPLTRRELAEFLPNQRAIRAFEKLFDLIPPDLLELFTQVEESKNEATSAIARTMINRSIINAINPTFKNFILVAKLSDLPQPQSGVIELISTYTYFFTTTVDLEGARIVSGRNTTILGASSENCRIKSTGLPLGTALISSEWTIPIRHISLESKTIFNLDASANPSQAIDWYGVNLVDCADIGTIKSFSNFIVNSMAFLNSTGLVFDGTVGTISFSNSIFVGQATGTIISLPSTLTVERRFRVSYSAFVVFGSSIGVSANTSATIPVEGYIYDTCNFSGGGTYVDGVQFDDNKARWIENRGISNSRATTGYYMIGNTTPTVIAAASTPVKAAGTTIEDSISQRFTVSTTNRATYDGAIDRDFRITATISLTSGNNHQISAYIFKDGFVIAESEVTLTTNSGGRLENGMMQATVDLSDSDYIEVFVENNTLATNITVKDLNVIIEAIN